MSDISTTAETRIRMAVRDKLGDNATITRLKQEKDVVHLEVVAPLESRRALEAILEALEGIDPYLRDVEKVRVELLVRSTWKPRAR